MQEEAIKALVQV